MIFQRDETGNLRHSMESRWKIHHRRKYRQSCPGVFSCRWYVVPDLMWFRADSECLKGSCVHQIQDHSHYVQGVAWDPLNEYVATQSSDRYVLARQYESSALIDFVEPFKCIPSANEITRSLFTQPVEIVQGRERLMPSWRSKIRVHPRSAWSDLLWPGGLPPFPMLGRP